MFFNAGLEVLNAAYMYKWDIIQEQSDNNTQIQLHLDHGICYDIYKENNRVLQLEMQIPSTTQTNITAEVTTQNLPRRELMTVAAKSACISMYIECSVQEKGPESMKAKGDVSMVWEINCVCFPMCERLIIKFHKNAEVTSSTKFCGIKV